MIEQDYSFQKVWLEYLLRFVKSMKSSGLLGSDDRLRITKPIFRCLRMPLAFIALNCLFTYLLLSVLPKDWSEMKRTMLGVGQCTAISGHFFDNYINNFHKTEVLTVILVCPIYKNLSWIKIYDINYNFLFVSVFSIL